MHLDEHALDRWIMGEAWIGSRIDAHLDVLCDQIGPRWSSTEAEWAAIEYIREQMAGAGLEPVAVEEYALDTWAWDGAAARIVADGRPIDLLPFHWCPPCDLQGPLVDVGHGTAREIEAVRGDLRGAVAVMALAYEPFTEPVPHTVRLQWLAEAGAAAAVAVETKSGGRMEYHSACDWRDPDPDRHPLPAVIISREDGDLLRRLARAGQAFALRVESRLYTAPSANVSGTLEGARWPEEHLVLGGHHDTVYGAPGGNDNASGTIAVLETARVLAALQAEQGVAPGRTIRFVTYGGEEQGFQGAFAYVARHYGDKNQPRLAINLDELSTGRMKGIVLAFPHLRALIQGQLDAMGDGLQCHVMAQLDPTSDHYPFLHAGLDAAFLWRWRFAGRHDDANFHHERGDTRDKVQIGELKTYVGQLARLLLCLSHLPPAAWPDSPVTAAQVRARLERERGTVVRVW